MSQTAGSTLGQIHELLASRRYSVSEDGDGILRIMEVDTGLTLRPCFRERSFSFP